MGLLRRLSAVEACYNICNSKKNCSPPCPPDCIKNCTPYPYSPGPVINKDEDVSADKISEAHHKISTVLIITLTLLSFTFFVVCCYALYVKFRLSRRRRSQPQTEDTQDEDFLDEEHGPMVDHPIWYIRTTGLQESIITAITVCKYKKDEGLIEGTECSICLSEFEEDETLRLLPKCNHAFHLPCIDTWLGSHTNCPMCRAPIVNNPAGTLSEEPNLVDSSSMENTQMEIVIDNGENSARIENSVPDLRIGEEEEAPLESEEDGRRVCESGSSSAEGENLQPRRRSVSLDDSTAAKFNRALATVALAEGSSGNSSRRLGHVNGAIVSKRVSKGSSSFRTKCLQSAPTSMKRSRSFNGKHMLSWHSRSQKKPNPPIRSF